MVVGYPALHRPGGLHVHMQGGNFSAYGPWDDRLTCGSRHQGLECNVMRPGGEMGSGGIEECCEKMEHCG